MKQHFIKSSLAAVMLTGALAGCATSVDWGGPLLHYRYDYDSRPVVSQAPIVAPAPSVTYTPTVTYTEPAVVYRDPALTRDPDSVITYRGYREPAVTTYYGQPTVIYGYQSPSIPYIDKGQ